MSQSVPVFASKMVEIREIWPRSRRRPLSATQHHPTTSLVGISLHCNEPWRFVSSILTAFVTATHCISIAYKPILFQCLARKGRKSNSYTNDIAYSNLEWTYRECWRDNDLRHWNTCYFDCKVLLRRTEEEGSGRRHDRSPDVCEVMTHEVYDGTLSIADEQMSCRIGCTLLMMSWLLICILPWRIPHDEITSLMCRRGSYLQFTR